MDEENKNGVCSSGNGALDVGLALRWMIEFGIKAVPITVLDSSWTRGKVSYGFSARQGRLKFSFDRTEGASYGLTQKAIDAIKESGNV